MKKLLALFSVAAVLASCGGGDGQELIELYPVKYDDTYQFIDREGKIVINPQFKRASFFMDGVSRVEIENDEEDGRKVGFIDKEGKYLVNADYKDATSFSEGLAFAVKKNSTPICINTSGEMVFDLPDAEEVQKYSEGLAGFARLDDEGKEQWGFIDKEGKETITPQFSNIGSFSMGLCPVKNDKDDWGYIDKEGKIVINYQFKRAMSFNEKTKTAIVRMGKKYGVIDEKGSLIINPQFKRMMHDGDNYLVRFEKLWGWVDKEGKYLINPQFKQAVPFSGSKLAAVSVDREKWGYIDETGKNVITYQFESAGMFNHGMALVESGEKYGFIDEEGKFKINPQYDRVGGYGAIYGFNYDSHYRVKSDFFDVAPIINLYKELLHNGKGLKGTETYDEVAAAFGKDPENIYRKYRSRVELREGKINDDISYEFEVNGNSYERKEVQKKSYYSNRYYTSYERVYNGKGIVDGYKLKLRLSYYGKSYGKIDQIIEEIENLYPSKTTREKRYGGKEHEIDGKILSIEKSGETRITIRVRRIIPDVGNVGNRGSSSSSYGSSYGY